MQEILIATGDPVVAESLQEIFQALVQPGILNGFQLSPYGSNQINVAAGAAMTDSGVIIFESEPNILTPPATAGSYTIYYTYVPSPNFGGANAVLQIAQGFLQPANFSGGVILGWWVYPGGVIQANQFISAPTFNLGPPLATQKGEFQVEFSPLSNLWALQYASTPPSNLLSITEGWNPTFGANVTKLTNNLGIQVSNSFVIPIEVPAYGIGQVMVDCQTDPAALLTVTLMDQLGNVTTPSNTNSFINNAFGRQVMQIPQPTTFGANSEIFILLTAQCQPSNSIYLKSVGFSSYTEPF